MPFDCTPVETRAQRDLRILRLARQAIARRGGWHRGGLGEPGVSMCAIGWLHHIGWEVGDRDYEGLARRLLWPALPLRWRFTDHWALAQFNDAPWRRKQRVVRLYDKAIRLAERRA